MYLTLVDTTGIQPYIFGSNRLRENIGASYLVDQATGEWAKTALSAICPGKKPLYAGGGNFVACFETKSEAVAFERLLTRNVLCDAPGLQVVLVHQNCDDHGSDSSRIFPCLEAAFQAMARKKLERVRSTPLLGLGVTRACVSTGLPASFSVSIQGKPFEVSAEIKTKHACFETANRRLASKEYLKPPEGYDFPYDMENLGASFADQSYIAVVHADGNGMGDEIRKIGKDYGGNDREYQAKLAEFSKDVQTAALAALNWVLNDLALRISDKLDEKGRMRLIIEHFDLDMVIPLKPKSERHEKWYLPFRPIVFGGDDITFVCDGRLGISLALSYLKHFEEETERTLGKRLTACAGVAIVKSHYPFARAYQLAEDLCKEAKKYRKAIMKERNKPQASNWDDAEEVTSTENWDGSCLDWHFALSGLSGEIGEIRKREFIVDLDADKPREKFTTGILNLRPVTLYANPSAPLRSWQIINKQVQAFQDADKGWADKRNKMKDLREVLRKGPEAVQKFKTIYRLSADALMAHNGWQSMEEGEKMVDRSELFDAIELADVYMPLTTNKSE